jgi:prophage regulatory protein
VRSFNIGAISTVLQQNDRLLRIRDICGDRRTGTQALISVARSTWWAGVKSGRFPKPIKLGGGITVWRESDIRALIEGSTDAA